MSAICVALIKEKGYLDYDEKVSTYWPEFAQNGKGNIIVSDILRHQANMHVLPELIELEWGLTHNIKLNKIGRVIEEMPLCKLPFGAKRTYHANSKDWIMNEIFRRVEPKGRTIGEYWRKEVKEQIDADIYFSFEKEELDKVYDVEEYSGWKQAWHMIKPKTADNYAALDIRSLFGNFSKFKTIMKEFDEGLGGGKGKMKT